MRFLRHCLPLLALIVLPALGIASGRVVWDISHTPIQGYDTDHNYLVLTQLLEANSFTVGEMTGDLIDTGLWNADIFVVSALSNYEAAYTAEEIDLVEHFVTSGGGLIILADNGASRPRNLSELARRFGVVTSRDDRIGNLVTFADDEALGAPDSIVFASGSALELSGQGGAEALAHDSENRIGIASKVVGEGRIIIIADADLWTNDNLGRGSNSSLALALFRELDRETLGRIYLPEHSRVVYLPVRNAFELSFPIVNVGEGSLGFGVHVGERSPITFRESHGLIETGESVDLEFTIFTADLEPDQILASQIVIQHNDPTQDALTFELELHTLPVEPTHFRNPANTGIDHSLLISRVTVEDQVAPAGLEIGVFTPDGYCAAAVRYSGRVFGFPVRGDDPTTEEVDGFRRGEPMRIVFFTPWDEVELAVNAEVIEGDPLFLADGFTVLQLDGRDQGEVTLLMRDRWSLVSLNVTPGSSNFSDIFAPLLEENMLLMVKDGEGRFWDVARNFSNLGEWNPLGGYQVKVRQPAELTVAGAQVDPLQPIQLRNRWNSVAFLPQAPLSLPEAVETIHDHLIIIKRGDGSFYYPRFDWDGIGAMEPGFGYQISITEPDELIYPQIQERIAGEFSATQYGVARSPFSASLLLIGLIPGDKVTAFPRSSVSDEHVADRSGKIGLPIWGDDPTTRELEGFIPGEQIEIEINDQLVEPVWVDGDGRYSDNGILVAEIDRQNVAIPQEPTITVSPNPFNDRVVFSATNISADARLTVFDLEGRTVLSREIPAGNSNGLMQVDIPANTLPSGVLLIKIESKGLSKTVKAIHLP